MLGGLSSLLWSTPLKAFLYNVVLYLGKLEGLSLDILLALLNKLSIRRMMERIARDKCFSLFGLFVLFNEKKSNKKLTPVD